MAQGLDFDLRQAVVSNSSFGPQEIEYLRDAITKDRTNYAVLREAVQELEQQGERSPAANVRLGVCQYWLGRYTSAIETLTHGDGGALAHYYKAKAHLAMEQQEEAIKSYQAASQAGYDRGVCALGQVECLRYGGKLDEALSMLDNLSGPVEETAEYLYQRAATISALGGNPEEVVALYERAVQSDGNHPGALFGLALENDRRGNDDEALTLYERSVARFPAHIGAMLNLGLLYDDRENYEKAVHCFQMVLSADPANPRARLYLKDAQASTDMFYDEDERRKRDRLSQVLNVNVTDFELSVRSRNCLQKMGVRTLGDLTTISEQELLSSKNFGETSLVEIKEMLASKGLNLGQFAREKAKPEPVVDTSHMSADEQALLAKPISELQLSVRARKCMVRLGIQTIGELIRCTGDELLECKNFGVTSLNEVREKLTAHSLKLRGD